MEKIVIENIGFLCWIFGAIISALSFLIMFHENGVMLYVGIFFFLIHLLGLFIVRESNLFTKEK